LAPWREQIRHSDRDASIGVRDGKRVNLKATTTRSTSGFLGATEDWAADGHAC